MKNRGQAASKALMLCASVTVFALSTPASAGPIDFNAGLDPAFSYVGVDHYFGPQGAEGGFNNMIVATSSLGGVFNRGPASPSIFTWLGQGTFDLNSFLIAGAWGNQTLTIQGWKDGALLQFAEVAVTTSPLNFAPGWKDLNELRILIDPTGYTDTTQFAGFGQHWVLDNLSVNENLNSVSSPATSILLGAALAVLVWSRRRRLVSNWGTFYLLLSASFYKN